MTQVEMILRHLQDYGSITTWESYEEYGITRLSDKIYRLRSSKYKITDEWIYRKNRYGKKIKFKKYVLEKEG